MAGFCHIWIPNYGLITRSLYEKVERKKNHDPFQWNSGCKGTFQELKKQLLQVPITALPDLTKFFNLYVIESRVTALWVKVKVAQSCLTLCDPMDGLHSPWNSPGQNTEVGSLSLLQGIFPTQGSNPGLPHCRWILYQLRHKESPRKLEWVTYPFCRRSSQPRNWAGVSCNCRRILYQLSYISSKTGAAYSGVCLFPWTIRSTATEWPPCSWAVSATRTLLKEAEN